MAGPGARVHAVFETVAAARDALERLAELGVGHRDVEVRSSIPLHGLVPPGLRLRSRVPVMAVLGGVLGGLGAFFLISFTSQAYPLPTGGMPIVALPPAGVVTFEGVAIGAILFTVATVLFECGLPGLARPEGPLDGHIAAGRIVVSAGGAGAEDGRWTERASTTAVEEGPTPA